MSVRLPIESLSNQALLEETRSLAVRERRLTARLIAALAEVDARKLHIDEGFPSLTAYCTRVLNLSEQQAYARLAVVKVARRFPTVLDRLDAGELTMTTVEMLGPYLTDENHVALLDKARHKSTRAVEEHVSELRRARGEPDLIPLYLMITPDTNQKLRTARDLLRHSLPDGNFATVVDRALDLLLDNLRRRMLAETDNPRSNVTESDSRYFPAALRRAVRKRDGGQCTFVGPHGRCPARGMLEYDHIIPIALGGKTTVDNVRLRCRAHNQRAAERELAMAGRPKKPGGNSGRTE